MRNLFYILTIGFVLCSACKQNNASSDISVANTTEVVTQEVRDRISATLEKFVSSGQIAGASALIYEKDKEVYFGAFGYQDREAKIPMDRNTFVKIYSMTKPVTGVALMTLHEEGKFDLDDAVEKYAPEFADMKVMAGVDEKGNLILEDCIRPMTIRDLTRHTAGFANPNNHNLEGIGPLMKEKDPMNRNNILTEMAELLGSVPLKFQPGTQWEYGICVDLQAFLVERISGIPYKEYVREHVLDKLGMSKTRYFIPAAERDQLSAIYRRDDKGVLNREPDSTAHSDYFNIWPLTRGGSGLTAPIDEYMTFARMLVNEGSHNGVQILKPETVKLMATNHLDESIDERSWLPSKGQVGFGIDFAVRLREPVDAEENNGVVGEFFWDGAASTLFWVDPVNELTAVLFVQLFPYDGIGLHKQFRDAVYGPYKHAL